MTARSGGWGQAQSLLSFPLSMENQDSPQGAQPSAVYPLQALGQAWGTRLGRQARHPDTWALSMGFSRGLGGSHAFPCSRRGV